MNHQELQAAVATLARYMGWRVLTVRRSIGKGRKWTTTTSIVGWPDCLLFNPAQPGRHLAVELKVRPDKLSVEQTAVLADLEQAGFETYVWYPEDVEKAAEILRRKAGPDG